MTEIIRHLQAAKYKRYVAKLENTLNWVPNTHEQKTLKSKQYTCACCGLESRPHRAFPSGYMEIVDGQVLCNMCASVGFLGRPINGEIEHGKLVYWPNLTQAEVIKLSQWAFVSVYRNDENAAAAQQLNQRVEKDLSGLVPQAHKELTDASIKTFVTYYHGLSDAKKQQLNWQLRHLRYWPNPNIYHQQIAFWSVASKQQITQQPSEHVA